MLYDSTKNLLRSIVHSLETFEKPAWDDLIESGKECLYEMHQMTRPSYRAYKSAGSDAKFPTHIPDSEGLNRAMPDVKVMVGAIRRKDRTMALQSGRAALIEMNGAGMSRAALVAAAARMEVRPIAAAVVVRKVEETIVVRKVEEAPRARKRETAAPRKRTAAVAKRKAAGRTMAMGSTAS